MNIPRIECLECTAIQQIKLGFTEVRRRYMKHFEPYTLALMRHMKISDAARHLRSSLDVMKEIQKRDL